MSSDRIKRILNNPLLVFETLGHRGCFNWMPDDLYLRVLYKIRMGKKLDIGSPSSFSEKLQWLKLHDRNPLYSRLVDKYSVREYVAEKIGEKYLIPLVGGPWCSFDEIDFDVLPKQFVLKCTHDSGGLVICKDKSSFDIGKARKKIEACLKHNFFYGQREWPYKGVAPRIIAEEYKEDPLYSELRDYKFFCFNGECKALFIATDRSSQTEETKFDFFDADFKHLPFTNGHPNALVQPTKPLRFEEMKQLASVLSEGIPQVRVDLYEVEGRVYFGEMTFFHWSGLMPFEPNEWDEKFGSWISLPDTAAK